MKDKDYIKELFSEKLSNHEVPVRSDLWSGIQSQLGNTATTAAAAKGISVAAKWAIGIASSVIVAGSVAWFASDGNNGQNQKQQLSRVQQENVSDLKVAEQKSEETLQPVASDVAASGQSTDLHVVKDGTHTAVNETIIDKNAAGTPAPVYVKEAASAVSGGSQAPNAPAANSNKTTDQKTAQSDKTVASSTSAENNSRKPVVGKIKEFFNVFSPNNDGVNDAFFLSCENLKDFGITVLNEKNQVVFKSTNPDFSWDGTIDGEMVPDGNYIYMVVSTDNNGNPINKIARLTIKRTP